MPDSRRTRAARLLLLGLTFATLTGGAVAAAQSATPETVDTTLCTVAPLPEMDLVEIAETVAPEATAAATADLTGEAADQETAGAVIATIRESVACTNANQPMRGFALFTDDYLRARFGGANADDLGHLLAAITRKPDVAAEADRLTLVSVTDIRRLEDGRVVATVTTENARERYVDAVVLAESGGRWLIDQVIAGQAEPAGTPVS